MELNEGKEFRGETVHIDGKAFVKCTFSKCRLIYSGGEMPIFNNCDMPDISFEFAGPAANTLKLLHTYNTVESGFKSLIYRTIVNLNSPDALPTAAPH